MAGAEIAGQPPGACRRDRHRETLAIRRRPAQVPPGGGDGLPQLVAEDLCGGRFQGVGAQVPLGRPGQAFVRQLGRVCHGPEADVGGQRQDRRQAVQVEVGRTGGGAPGVSEAVQVVAPRVDLDQDVGQRDPGQAVMDLFFQGAKPFGPSSASTGVTTRRPCSTRTSLPRASALSSRPIPSRNSARISCNRPFGSGVRPSRE